MKDNEAHKSDLSEDVAYTYAIEKHIHNWYSEITDVPKKYRYKCNEVLSHIDVYQHPGDVEQEVPPHWHFITFGLSLLKWDHSTESLSSGECEVGSSFELTFRVKYVPLEENPPQWPLCVLRVFAEYVYNTGNVISVGDHVPWNRPLDLAGLDLDSYPGTDKDVSLVRHILVAEDPELMMMDKGMNKIQFRQLLGVLGPEMKAAQSWKGSGILALLSLTPQAGGSYFITDLSRDQSVFDYQPYFIQLVGTEITSAGSNLAHVTALCSWEGVHPAHGTADIIRDSTGESIEEHILEAVTLYIDTEVAELLPVIVRGRLAHDYYFVFESVHGAVIIFIPPGCQEPMVSVDWNQPLKAQGPALQIYCGYDFIQQLAEAVKSVNNQYQSPKMSREISLTYPRVTIIITNLSDEAVHWGAAQVPWTTSTTQTPPGQATQNGANTSPGGSGSFSVVHSKTVQPNPGSHGKIARKSTASAAQICEPVNGTNIKPESVQRYSASDKEVSDVMCTCGIDETVANNAQQPAPKPAKPPVPKRSSSTLSSANTNKAPVSNGAHVAQQRPHSSEIQLEFTQTSVHGTDIVKLPQQSDSRSLSEAKIQVDYQEQPRYSVSSFRTHDQLSPSTNGSARLVNTGRSNNACVVERNCSTAKEVNGEHHEWSVASKPQKHVHERGGKYEHAQSRIDTGHSPPKGASGAPFERFLQEKAVVTPVTGIKPLSDTMKMKDKDYHQGDVKTRRPHSITNKIVPVSGDQAGTSRSPRHSLPDSYNTYSLPRSASKKQEHLSDAQNWHSLPRSAGRKKPNQISTRQDELQHEPLSIDEKIISGFSDLHGVSVPGVDALSTPSTPRRKSLMGMIQGLKCFKPASPGSSISVPYQPASPGSAKSVPYKPASPGSAKSVSAKSELPRSAKSISNKPALPDSIKSVPYKSAFKAYSKPTNASAKHGLHQIVKSNLSHPDSKYSSVRTPPQSTQHQKQVIGTPPHEAGLDISPPHQKEFQLNSSVMSLDWDDLPIPGSGVGFQAFDSFRPMSRSSSQGGSSDGGDDVLLDESSEISLYESDVISSGSCGHSEKSSSSQKIPDLSMVLEVSGCSDIDLNSSSGSSTATECVDTSRSTTPIANQSNTGVHHFQTPLKTVNDENIKNGATKSTLSPYKLTFDSMDQSYESSSTSVMEPSPVYNAAPSDNGDLSAQMLSTPADGHSMRSDVSSISISGSYSDCSVFDSRDNSCAGSMSDVSMAGTNPKISIPTAVMRRRSARRRSSSRSRSDGRSSAMKLVAVSPERMMGNLEDTLDLSAVDVGGNSEATFSRDSMFILQSDQMDIQEMVNSLVLPQGESAPFSDDHLMNSTSLSLLDYDLSRLTDVSMLPNSMLTDKCQSSRDGDNEMTMTSLDSTSSLVNSSRKSKRLSLDNQLDDHNSSQDSHRSSQDSHRSSQDSHRRHSDVPHSLKSESRISTRPKKSSPKHSSIKNTIPTKNTQSAIEPSQPKKTNILPASRKSMGKGKSRSPGSVDDTEITSKERRSRLSHENIAKPVQNPAVDLNYSTDSIKYRDYSSRSPKESTNLPTKSPARGTKSDMARPRKADANSGRRSVDKLSPPHQTEASRVATKQNKPTSLYSTGIPSATATGRKYREVKQNLNPTSSHRGYSVKNGGEVDASSDDTSRPNSRNTTPVSAQKHHHAPSMSSQSVAGQQHRRATSRQSSSTPTSQGTADRSISSVSSREATPRKATHRIPTNTHPDLKDTRQTRPFKPNQEPLPHRRKTPEHTKTFQPEGTGKTSTGISVDGRTKPSRYSSSGKKETMPDRNKAHSQVSNSSKISHSNGSQRYANS